MEGLFSRNTCRFARIPRRRVFAARLHVRAFSSLQKRPQSVVSDVALPSKIPESSQTAATSKVSNLFSLKDRTIIVTGAGRGLGITLAAAVLEAGGNVACLDVLPRPSEVEWRRIVQTQGELGLDATYHQCDTTDEPRVQEVLAEIASKAEQRRKPIRGLVHCAGIQQMVDAIDYPIDGFKRILEVNVTGSFVMAKHTARLMKEAKVGGSIVLIASMSGQIANRVCTHAQL